MKKKILITAGSLFAVLLIAAALFKLRYDKMVRTIEEQPVETVDLAMLPDGVYSGSFSDFLLSVTVEVTVADHSIADISVVEQRCGPGYDGLETVDRILEAQDPGVDAVSGATGSSRAIMIAVYRALEGEPQ